MAEVTLRPQAFEDLTEIFAYIYQGSPKHAESFAELVHTNLERLAKRPRLGRSRPELMPEVRTVTVGRYIIFYLPRVRGIEVVRVLHGSRDITSIFEDEP
jgi:toxin ParE1/3/4